MRYIGMVEVESGRGEVTAGLFEVIIATKFYNIVTVAWIEVMLPELLPK